MVCYPCWQCFSDTTFTESCSQSLFSPFLPWESLAGISGDLAYPAENLPSRWMSAVASLTFFHFFFFFFSLPPLWCSSQFWLYAEDPRCGHTSESMGLVGTIPFFCQLMQKGQRCPGCLPLLRISAFYLLTPIWKKHVLIQRNHPFSCLALFCQFEVNAAMVCNIGLVCQ